jgi:hypothetical protein
MPVSLTDIYVQYADACLPYRHLCPVCRCLSPLPTFMSSMQIPVSLTDNYVQNADACLPYRNLYPVCRCLSPLPTFISSMQMPVSLTYIYFQYADACLPYLHLYSVCRCLSPLPALLTSISICLSVLSRFCAHCRTEASDDKSNFTTTNWPTPSMSLVSCRISAAASSAFFRSLHAAITRAPFVQKCHLGCLH